jgi:hypothetical protein
MYNAIFGQNPLAGILKGLLELDDPRDGVPEMPEFDYMDGEFKGDMDSWCDTCAALKYYPTGRFRDIWIEPDGKHVTLYTRNGGGNRDFYFYVFLLLRKHPQYVDEDDDDFDSTYAYVKFRLTDDQVALLAAMPRGDRAQWEQFFADIKDGKQTPEVQRAVAAAKPLLDNIVAALETPCEPS